LFLEVKTMSAAKRQRTTQTEADDQAKIDIYGDMTKEHASKFNFESCNIESDVPECTLSAPCWMGIDEAGRGPVCGPMTYGAAYGPIEGEKRLRGMGFADSKKLTEEKRDELFKDIKGAPDFLGWIVSILSAADISAAMMGRINYNLNALSHDTAIDMIKKVLAKGVNLKELYIDTVGIEHLYQQKLEKIFPQLNITVTKKADDKFPICSAASICAKVTRDQVIEQWRHLELVNLSKQIGSGYPGDPITKKWIGTATDPIFGFPSIVRFSWATAKKIIVESCAPATWEDDGDSDDDDTPSVLSFFKKPDAPKKRHRFFFERCLEGVGDF